MTHRLSSVFSKPVKQGCITFFQSVLCSKAGHTRFESQPVQQEPAKIQIVNGHQLGEDNGPAGGIPASILSLRGIERNLLRVWPA